MKKAKRSVVGLSVFPYHSVMTQADSSRRLERKLGLWAVFAIASGAMISSGLFVLPGLAFAMAGPSMILAYALAGLLNIPTMLAQAELSTAMPKSAGSYFVVERSLGAYLGTVAGLINWSAIGLKAAFALLGIGTLADLLFPGVGEWTVKLTAIVACALFMILNLVSVEGTGRLQGWLVAALIGILLVFVLTGLPRIDPSHYRPVFQGGIKAFITVTGMVFVSFGGLTKVVDVAEEVSRPSRNLPLGMFLSYAVVNALYVGVAFVLVGVLDGAKLGGSLHPVTDGAGQTMRSVGLVVVGIGAFLAYATTGNAGILSASRSPLAMSHDGLLPSFLARIHPRYKTPHVAVLLTGFSIMLVIAFLSLENLVKTASTMLILSLGLINVSVMVMRKSRFEGYRPSFRMPLVPWLPLLTLLVYAFIIAEMGSVAILMTLGFIAAAGVWYVVYVQNRINRESAAAHLVKATLSKEIVRTNLEDELVQISLERDEVVTDRFDTLVRSASLLDIPEQLTARELFRRLGELLEPELKLPAAKIEAMLRERERQASTVIYPGLAIPHMIVEGKGIFHLALVRCVPGVVFSDLQEPVHAAFVLAGSKDERSFHLRALMSIAHVVQEPEFQKRWKAATHPEQLRDIVLLSRRLRDE